MFIADRQAHHPVAQLGRPTSEVPAQLHNKLRLAEVLLPDHQHQALTLRHTFTITKDVFEKTYNRDDTRTPARLLPDQIAKPGKNVVDSVNVSARPLAMSGFVFFMSIHFPPVSVVAIIVICV